MTNTALIYYFSICIKTKLKHNVKKKTIFVIFILSSGLKTIQSAFFLEKYKVKR